jgi:hypothetical protein
VEKLSSAVHRLWMPAAVGIVSFAAAAVLMATAGALLTGRLTTGVSALSLGVGLTIGGWAARHAGFGTTPDPRPASDERMHRAVNIAALLAFSIVVLRQFLWLARLDGGAVTQPNPYNFGDLPLHWTYVAYFSSDAPFWPENPIFAGKRLSYPIGADLLAALFVKLGVGVGSLLRVTGLVASLALLVALHRWGGSLAVLAVVFSGGLAVDRFAAGEFLRPADFDLPWKNVLLALFVPQRGFLYALPAGLLLLWSAREGLLRERRGLGAPIEGLLWGALPLFHVHTFLVVSLAFGAWSLVAGRVRAALPSLAIAFPLATASLWWVTDGFAAARMIWWKPGWMMTGEDPLVFLPVNFGLILPLAVAVLARPPRATARESRIVMGTGLALFTLLFFVMLAPWEWDNTKALVWAVLLMFGPLAAWLGERPAWLRLVLVVLLLAPGVPALLGSLRAGRALVVFEDDEKQEVCDGLRGVPPSARIATSQTFNHPVALCGRALVAGYGGHLWTHGIDAGPVEERLQALMKGWPGWQDRARELGATHVFWGFREERDFPGSARPWERDREPLWRGRAGSLYRVSGEAAEAEVRP